MRVTIKRRRRRTDSLPGFTNTPITDVAPEPTNDSLLLLEDGFFLLLEDGSFLILEGTF